jgi:hypothetical protein
MGHGTPTMYRVDRGAYDWAIENGSRFARSVPKAYSFNSTAIACSATVSTFSTVCGG